MQHAKNYGNYEKSITFHFREIEANKERELQRQHEREMADRQIKFTENLR